LIACVRNWSGAAYSANAYMSLTVLENAFKMTSPFAQKHHWKIELRINYL